MAHIDDSGVYTSGPSVKHHMHLESPGKILQDYFSPEHGGRLLENRSGN